MSKAFDTKLRILKLLRAKPRTVTQISNALGLAQSTVSQHIDELRDSGAIEGLDGVSSKKWKYYKVNESYYSRISKQGENTQGYSLLGKAVIAIVVIGIVSYGVMSLFAFYGNHPSPNVTPTISITSTGNPEAVSIAAKRSITPAEPRTACTVMFVNQTFNTRVVGYNGISSYNGSNVNEYVIAPGSTGTIHLNISKPNTSTNMSIDNFAELYYTVNGNQTSSRNDADGLSISFNRTSENLTGASPSALVTVTISASSNASEGAYWLILPEGPCKMNGISAILTVGSAPYNGTIAAPLPIS